MDFTFTKEEQAFLQEIRDFLKKELPPNWEGPTYIEDEMEDEEFFKMGRKLAPKMGAKGWLTMAWPKEYGGQARSYYEQAIFKEEMAYQAAPGIDFPGIAMAGPTILAFGNAEQKARFLPPISRGEVIWCQGFSEPEAGSDLAAVKTTAVLKGDHFVVNGQKVWNSGGHLAQWMFMLARSDPQAPKHKGISFLLVDMKTPGLEVRPLKNIAGGDAFNEVFLDDVKVPVENLVGKLNEGWKVATSLLTLERSGIERLAYTRRLLDELNKFAREELKGDTSPRATLIRHKLAQAAIECEVGRLLAYRVAWMQQNKQVPQMEGSMSKVFGSELMQRVSGIGMQMLGHYGELLKGSKWVKLGGRVSHVYQSSLGRTIGAGTSEIQRTIIARGLGLPRG
ncbi:MAG: acyl-CoA dehydrogenase family protein [Dehalococcoidia bacterium]|nr:acyl-CoA dehydrogenase family protein [Dehalococcoidia bacterium]